MHVLDELCHGFLRAEPVSRVLADGDLYVATVGQLSGADPLIHRRPLRTEPSDLKHLNGTCRRPLSVYSELP